MGEGKIKSGEGRGRGKGEGDEKGVGEEDRWGTIEGWRGRR